MSKDYNLVDSTMNALNPLRLLGKLIIMLVFISILALDKLMFLGDKAVLENTSVLVAVYSAYKYALYRAFGTIFPILRDIITGQFTMLSHPFELVISTFFFVLLILTVYQPIDLIINILDGQRGKTTSLFFRIMVTLLIVILTSGIIYLGLGETGISYSSAINQTIINSTINVTNGTTNVPTISLV